MNGWYTIGIHAHEDVDYTIAVSNSKVSVGLLSKGIPMEYVHSKERIDPATFSYFHYSEESFYIVLEENYGYAHIMVNSLKTDEEASALAAKLKF